MPCAKPKDFMTGGDPSYLEPRPTPLMPSPPSSVAPGSSVSCGNLSPWHTLPDW